MIHPINKKSAESAPKSFTIENWKQWLTRVYYIEPFVMNVMRHHHLH